VYDAPKEHQHIANLSEQLKFDNIILVGNEFSKTQTSDAVLKFKTTEAAHIWFQQQDFTGSEILLKGSRSMKMEKILE
jgi:UDP-N-acetylmuramoyl-tripeptide--D-alanyl-D-alanine ligase